MLSETWYKSEILSFPAAQKRRLFVLTSILGDESYSFVIFVFFVKLFPAIQIIKLEKGIEMIFSKKNPFYR